MVRGLHACSFRRTFLCRRLNKNNCLLFDLPVSFLIMVSFVILIVGKKQAEENVVQEKDKEEKTNAEETRGWARFHISKEGQREDWRKLVNEYKKEKGKPLDPFGKKYAISCSRPAKKLQLSRKDFHDLIKIMQSMIESHPTSQLSHIFYCTTFAQTKQG